MRQVLIQVPRGNGHKILNLVEEHKGINLTQIAATAQQDTEWDLIIVNISNRNVGPLLDDLEAFPEFHATLIPRHVFPMSPPASEIPDQVIDVTPRSPIEIWLNGLQSIGSWKSFLGYSAAAGVVVWIGMFTNTIFLLVAAMLLAPFASPALNVAIATASGDTSLLRSSLLRYVLSLLTMIVTTGVLSLAVGPQTTTPTMISISKVSAVAVFLPLVAGAAGALNLVQSENSSLVTGAATGVMVAASLAPPAGLIGMAAALQEWSMATNGLFLLGLQLVAINVSGVLIFRLYGLRPKGARYTRGTTRVFWTSVVVTTVLLVGLLTWQFASPYKLQEATLEQRVAGAVHRAIRDNDLVEPVQVNVDLQGPSTSGRPTTLIVAYVRPQPTTTMSTQEIEEELVQAITTHLRDQEFRLDFLFSVNVVRSMTANQSAIEEGTTHSLSEKIRCYSPQFTCRI